MKKTKPEIEMRTVSVRLPEDLIQTMEDLRVTMQACPEYYGKITVNTAVVIRMALLAGLETLKQKYPA